MLTQSHVMQGGTVDDAKTKEIMKVAYEAGINTFDT